MIAILAALVIQDAAYPGRLVALPAPWEHVEVGEWQFRAATSDDRAIMFTRPATRQRAWVRFEYRAGGDRLFRSSRMLVEADCEQGRIRILQSTTYSENNLEGTSVALPPSDWSFAPPETMAEGQLEAACES